MSHSFGFMCKAEAVESRFSFQNSWVCVTQRLYSLAQPWLGLNSFDEGCSVFVVVDMELGLVE
jgi:hypothetical protein